MSSDKYSDLSETEQAEFLEAFNSGDYTEHYEGGDVRSIIGGMAQRGDGYHKIAGYLLGRFSTYEIREIEDEVFAGMVKVLRADFASCGLYDL